jgi:hypothetical protein
MHSLRSAASIRRLAAARTMPSSTPFVVPACRFGACRRRSGSRRGHEPGP